MPERKRGRNMDSRAQERDFNIQKDNKLIINRIKEVLSDKNKSGII